MINTAAVGSFACVSPMSPLKVSRVPADPRSQLLTMLWSGRTAASEGGSQGNQRRFSCRMRVVPASRIRRRVSPQGRDEAVVLLQKSVGSVRKDKHTRQEGEKHRECLGEEDPQAPPCQARQSCDVGHRGTLKWSQSHDLH